MFEKKVYHHAALIHFECFVQLFTDLRIQNQFDDIFDRRIRWLSCKSNDSFKICLFNITNQKSYLSWSVSEISDSMQSKLTVSSSSAILAMKSMLELCHIHTVEVLDIETPAPKLCLNYSHWTTPNMPHKYFHSLWSVSVSVLHFRLVMVWYRFHATSKQIEFKKTCLAVDKQIVNFNVPQGVISRCSDNCWIVHLDTSNCKCCSTQFHSNNWIYHS